MANVIQSAGSAAGLGATIGTAAGPIGTAVGAGVGALVGGGAAAIGNAIQKKKLKKAMEHLGLSEAEREQLAAGQQQAAAAQAGAQQREVQRQAMAGGGGATPFAGHAAALQRDIGATAGEAGAQSRLQADALSRQIAEAQRQELLRRFDQQAASADAGVASAAQAADAYYAREAQKEQFRLEQEQIRAMGINLGGA